MIYCMCVEDRGRKNRNYEVCRLVKFLKKNNVHIFHITHKKYGKKYGKLGKYQGDSKQTKLMYNLRIECVGQRVLIGRTTWKSWHNC